MYMYLGVMYKSSAFCVGRLITSSNVPQALNNGLCNIIIINSQLMVLSVYGMHAWKGVVLAVFPAPFWPVMSVSGIPN